MKLGALLFCLTATLIAGCTSPSQPTGHPGAPPVVSKFTVEKAYPYAPQVPGNIAPKKYGVEAMMDYASIQAAATRPDAEIAMHEKQFRMAPTTGRIKTVNGKTPSSPQG